MILEKVRIKHKITKNRGDKTAQDQAKQVVVFIGFDKCVVQQGFTGVTVKEGYAHDAKRPDHGSGSGKRHFTPETSQFVHVQFTKLVGKHAGGKKEQ